MQKVNWRERVVLARERGEFAREDMEAWGDATTCCVGEYTQMLADFQANPVTFQKMFLRVSGHPIFFSKGLSGDAHRAIKHNEFDELDHILDKIEDRVLQLKREMNYGQAEAH